MMMNCLLMMCITRLLTIEVLWMFILLYMVSK